jgi:hypothetical protein
MRGSLGATLTDVAWVITAYAIKCYRNTHD